MAPGKMISTVQGENGNYKLSSLSASNDPSTIGGLAGLRDFWWRLKKKGNIGQCVASNDLPNANSFPNSELKNVYGAKENGKYHILCI